MNLFKTKEADKWLDLSNDELDKEIKSVYFIKKFKVLEFLQGKSTILEGEFQRSLE